MKAMLGNDTYRGVDDISMFFFDSHIIPLVENSFAGYSVFKKNDLIFISAPIRYPAVPDALYYLREDIQ